VSVVKIIQWTFPIHSTGTSGTAVFSGLPLNTQKAYNIIISATSILGQSTSISREVQLGEGENMQD